MTRRQQPTEPRAVELAPPPPADAPSLPVLCDEIGRGARSIAGRIDRAAADLAGPANAANGPTLALGHQDVWRFEVEIARAITDLRAMLADVAAWRRQRDAEVTQATLEAGP